MNVTIFVNVIILCCITSQNFIEAGLSWTELKRQNLEPNFINLATFLQVCQCGIDNTLSHLPFFHICGIEFHSKLTLVMWVQWALQFCSKTICHLKIEYTMYPFSLTIFANSQVGLSNNIKLLYLTFIPFINSQWSWSISNRKTQINTISTIYTHTHTHRSQYNLLPRNDDMPFITVS